VGAAAALLVGTRGSEAAGAPSAMLLGKPVTAADGDQLLGEVLSALLARYAQAQGIRATPEEVAAYRSQVQRVLERDRDAAVAQRDALARQLAAGGQPEAERQALARQLEAAERSAQMFEQTVRESKDPADRAARDEVSAASIVRWKTMRALYRQYGGRIIFQQAGPEPLDALRRFLEDGEKQGDFRIADPALEPTFWRYFRNDAMHSFYPRGSPQEAQAFDVAPWQDQGR
jgi:hypothetical protein